MELQGTVKKIGDVQTFNNNFQKRELILLTEEQYPQPISIEFLQDKISLLDSLSEGDKIKVSINIKGREWTNPQGEVKYFNSISGWRLEKMASDFTEPTTSDSGNNNTTVKEEPVKNENPFANDGEDDLPF